MSKINYIATGNLNGLWGRGRLGRNNSGRGAKMANIMARTDLVDLKTWSSGPGQRQKAMPYSKSKSA